MFGVPVCAAGACPVVRIAHETGGVVHRGTLGFLDLHWRSKVEVLVAVKVCFITAAVGAQVAREAAVSVMVHQVLLQVGLLGGRERAQVTLEGPDVAVRQHVPFKVAPIVGFVLTVPALVDGRVVSSHVSN